MKTFIDPRIKKIPTKAELEKHRKIWAKVAKQYKWYKEPFYVQVWINKKGKITDSVSTKITDRDYLVFDTERD